MADDRANDKSDQRSGEQSDRQPLGSPRAANSVSRRDAIKLGAGVGAGAFLSLEQLRRFAHLEHLEQFVRLQHLGAVGDAAVAVPTLIERAIPSTGEKLPVVGIGTARSYEAPTVEELPVLRLVLRRFPELGGKLLDTAPAYGSAESVVGEALSELKNRDKYFLATKVSIRGGGDRAAAEAQMQESLKRLKTDHVDLMQIWNVSNPGLIAPLLDEWKAAKKIRYTGITSSSKRDYEQLEAAMKAHKLDFVQVDLAIDNRSAQERIIPLAADRGMAVLINLPFGRTRVFQRVLDKPLPDWTKEIDASSWAQVFLKYIIANPAVTAVIPGTATIPFLVDNSGASHGRLPDAAMRKRIESYFDDIA